MAVRRLWQFNLRRSTNKSQQTTGNSARERRMGRNAPDETGGSKWSQSALSDCDVSDRKISITPSMSLADSIEGTDPRDRDWRGLSEEQMVELRGRKAYGKGGGPLNYENVAPRGEEARSRPGMAGRRQKGQLAGACDWDEEQESACGGW
eukprot:TRINITY_DN31454_c0_g1_i1.p1 TRINITY_DN31454_c0_g1~~TRINITY_DN31454_c0_g1_i1.p1  ORF type:complete len:158 (+),score=9.71 TRINITY_DN31454_c0_g1_i1:26-475(+)